jgi:hypothetical protein
MCETYRFVGCVYFEDLVVTVLKQGCFVSTGKAPALLSTTELEFVCLTNRLWCDPVTGFPAPQQVRRELFLHMMFDSDSGFADFELHNDHLDPASLLRLPAACHREKSVRWFHKGQQVDYNGHALPTTGPTTGP